MQPPFFHPRHPRDPRFHSRLETGNANFIGRIEAFGPPRPMNQQPHPGERMSVTVDHEPLPAETLGLKTVGHVLSHLRRVNRLVTNILIDGHAPDLNGLVAVRKSPLIGHTIFIETAEPREMALNVLEDVEEQLDETE